MGAPHRITRGVWGGTTREQRAYYRQWGRMPGPPPLIRMKGERR